MPRKNVLQGAHTVQAQSMSATFTSPYTNIQYLDNLMIQISYTGTPAGTFAIEGSNDYNPNISPDASHWGNLPLSGTPTAVGSADTIDIQMTQLACSWIRLVYTRTSGTGVCDVYITGKEV